MPEKLISSLTPKEQKLIKPTPEVIAEEVFGEGVLADIKSLCDFIRLNDLRIKWVGKNGWGVECKKMQVLRRIRINPSDKDWYVTLHFFPQYNEHITDAEMHHFVWNNLGGFGCDALNTGGNKCGNYMNLTFDMFGKACANQCCNSQIKIMNANPRLKS